MIIHPKIGAKIVSIVEIMNAIVKSLELPPKTTTNQGITIISNLLAIVDIKDETYRYRKFTPRLVELRKDFMNLALTFSCPGGPAGI